MAAGRPPTDCCSTAGSVTTTTTVDAVVTATSTSSDVSGFPARTPPDSGFDSGSGLVSAAVRLRPKRFRLLLPELPPWLPPPCGGKTARHYCSMENPPADFWVKTR